MKNAQVRLFHFIRQPIFLVLTLLSILGGTLLVGGQFWQVSAAPHTQNDLPVYNWRVCEDLGMGTVPGVPGTVQRFRVCHRQGWDLLAYCLQPLIPPPPLETICERINEDTFWCGDQYQLLRYYQILQTPTPGPSDTPVTPTETLTPVPTLTQTITPLPTGTSTPTPTDTPFPTVTETPSPTLTETPPVPTVPVMTQTQRPPPGGSGNVDGISAVRWFFGFLLLAGGLWLAINDRQRARSWRSQ
jgi:hypothetical protein